ncbi:MAG: hypothetical protein ACRDMV_22085 [Streptosporangiales bacterium]
MPVRNVGRARFLSLLVAALLVAATATIGGASTARAAASQRVHVSGTTFTKESQTVTVSVRLRLLERGALRLKAPGDGSYVKVASGRGPRKLSYDLRLSCPKYAGSCTHDGRQVPARNGVWRVKFTSNKLLSGGQEKASFTVAVPPERPAGLTAKRTDGRHVRVGWRRGVEPDLTSYLLTVGGQEHRITVGHACGAKQCAATFAGPGSGGSVGVRLQAVRAGAAGSLTSPASTTSVHLPAPRPTAGPSGRRGTSRGPAGGSRSHHGGAFPSPTLGGGGAGGGAGTAKARLPRGGSLVPGGSEGPYPTFGKRPAVAPFTPVGNTSAQRGPRVEPLAHSGLRGAAAVPVALGLAAALVIAHLWLWSRSRNRLWPVGAGRGRS